MYSTAALVRSTWYARRALVAATRAATGDVDPSDLGLGAVHLAARLDRAGCLLAGQELDGLEAVLGVVGLELGVLRHDGDGQRHQRLMVLGPHFDRTHRGV